MLVKMLLIFIFTQNPKSKNEMDFQSFLHKEEK